MRLPNINNVSLQIGNPVPEGYHQELHEFFRGEDLLFNGYVEVDNTPLDISKWTLTVVIKSNSHAETTIWEGKLNNGLTMTANKPGHYKILVPKEVFNCYPQGTYWLGLIAKEKLGQGKETIDRTRIVANIPFSLVQGIGSQSSVDTRLDSERTVPSGVNITKL